MISATLYSDPACPWAYSESPALRVIEWRYGDQLDWRLVLVGLTEDASQYERRGYTPIRGALGQAMFRRRYGMPFSPAPKARLSATSRACRAVVAARMSDPGSEWRVFRAIQLHELQLGDAARRRSEPGRARCATCPASTPSRSSAGSTLPTWSRPTGPIARKTRQAAGSAAELQGKTATTDGPVRFTAPSVVFELNGMRLVAGGFQPVEAYDVLVANIDPTLHREPAPEEPAPLLERFPDGLTTQEVAALIAQGNDKPDRAAAEAALLELLGAGEAVRDPLGDDALWRSAVTPTVPPWSPVRSKRSR